MTLGPAPAELNTCCWADCEKPIHARGFCHNHYMKQYRNGAIAGASGSEGGTIRIRFYASEELERGLRRLSRITGEPRSHILRDIVEASLKAKGVL